MELPNTSKDKLINVRVHSSTRDFIDKAAKDAGKSRSDFMLSAAYEKALEARLDKTEFLFDEEQWEKLMDILDNPPKPNKKLLELLATKPPWE